jgi:hypothetical protein
MVIAAGDYGLINIFDNKKEEYSQKYLNIKDIQEIEDSLVLATKNGVIIASKPIGKDINYHFSYR